MERVQAARGAGNQQQPQLLPTSPQHANHDSSEILGDLLNMVDKKRIVTRAPEEPFRLTFFDVTCLLVNRAIGTGIFNGPQEIMNGVRSPGIAILLWICGCIYGLSGAHVFLEYGLNVPRYIVDGVEQAVPRSGGELHYLHYVFPWPRYKMGTVLLSGVVFGISFICAGNMASNCIDCAQRLVQIADGNVNNEGLIRGIAIVIATITCFIHAFSRRGGILLNNLLAVVKVVFLIFMIAATWVIIGGRYGVPAFANDKRFHSMKGAASESHQQPENHAQAFLFVIFAFFGFDQPSYVLGEIHHPRRNFPRSMWWGMGIVSILYVAVNICYMVVVPGDVQMNKNVAREFFSRLFNSNSRTSQTFDAFLALSSFGNVVVWTYTAARMKQEIAKQGFLPFASFFAQNKDVSLGRLLLWFEGAEWNSGRRRIPFLNPANHSEKTPVGALILHLLSCIVLILATLDMKAFDSYNILSTLFSYLVAAWFGSLLAIGILILHFRGPPATQPVQTPNHNTVPDQRPVTRSWKELTRGTVNPNLSVTCAALYLIGSLYPIIASWIPPKDSEHASVAWYIMPVSALCILAFSTLWFFGFIAIAAYRSRNGRKRVVYVSEPEFDWAEGYPQRQNGAEEMAEREANLRLRRGGLILTHETIYKMWQGTEMEGLANHQTSSVALSGMRQQEPVNSNGLRRSGATFANTDFAASRHNPTRAVYQDRDIAPEEPNQRDGGLMPMQRDSSAQRFSQGSDAN